MKKFIQCLRRYRRDQRGIAAVEMALASPILFLLLLGGTEMGRYILVHQKVEKMAFAVADVTAQYETVTSAEIATIMNASSELMNPHEGFATHGRMILTAVHKDPDETNQQVRWQCEGGGSLTALSQVGQPNTSAKADLPGDLELDDDDHVIVSEVFYTYQPMITWFQIQNVNLYKTAMFRPRLGQLSTVAGC